MAILKPPVDTTQVEPTVGREELLAKFEKIFPNTLWELNEKAGKCIPHLQEQAASQGDVVMLHGQVQGRAPRLPLLGVDVGPRGHQQQQTRQAVAHHGYMYGIQTYGPSTGMVMGRQGCWGSAWVSTPVFIGAVSQPSCM